MQCREERPAAEVRFMEKFRSSGAPAIHQGPAPRYLLSDEVAKVIALLEELRETTQSRSVFDAAGRLLASLRS